jgi:repressor LexA
VLIYLARQAREGYRPSIREISAEVGAANETVMSDLSELVRRGLVADCDLPDSQRGRRAARAYVITNLGLAQARGEPVLPQRAAAGRPTDQPVVTGFDVEVDAGTMRPGLATTPPGHLTVQAFGDSMVDGIQPDDVVLVRQHEEAHNGQIVLAEVRGVADEAALTLKRIYWEDDRIRLQPDNPRYEPMHYATDAVRVLGVAVETVRRHRLH